MIDDGRSHAEVDNNNDKNIENINDNNGNGKKKKRVLTYDITPQR